MRSRSRKTEQSGVGNKQDHSDPYAGFLHNYSQLKMFESGSRAILTSIRSKTGGQLCSCHIQHTCPNSLRAICCALMNSAQKSFK